MERQDNVVIIEPIHPGGMLRGELEARGITLEEFARLSGVPLAEVELFVNERKDFTQEFATAIEKVIPEMPADFWMRWHETFCERRDNYALRRQQREMAQKREEVIDGNLNTALVYETIGDMPGSSVRRMEALDRAARFVDTIGGADEIVAVTARAGLFKMSQKLRVDVRNLRAWIFCAMYLGAKRAAQLDVPYTPAQGRQFCAWLAAEANSGRGLVAGLVEPKAAELGIVCYHFAHFKHTPVDAYSCWQKGHPVIAVTHRHNDSDRLAFDILHEMGHILLHEPRERVSGDVTHSDADEAMEREANRFAEDALIPCDVWHEMAARVQGMNSYAATAVLKRIAPSFGVAPTIAVHRYCNETKQYKVKREIRRIEDAPAKAYQ